MLPPAVQRHRLHSVPIRSLNHQPCLLPAQEFVTTKPGDKEPVCGRQEYSVTEDRPIEKERRTTIMEHHLYEKTFVVETRLVGERPLPGDPRVRWCA